VVVTLTTTASTATTIAHPGIFYAAWLPFSGLGLVGIAFMIPGKRCKASTILTLLVLGASIFAVGCGGSSSHSSAPVAPVVPVVPAYNGTPQGTYTVTVTGNSSNVTQSTTFSLTVK
jgi:hypothetical protein